jgi:hypothetical protein
VNVSKFGYWPVYPNPKTRHPANVFGYQGAKCVLCTYVLSRFAQPFEHTDNNSLYGISKIHYLLHGLPFLEALFLPYAFISTTGKNYSSI